MTLTDYINESRSLMVAAAGHGKTQAIAECVKLYPDGQCPLILTHTHAGIASIKAKLAKLDVNANKCHVETITSFAQQFALAYASKEDLPEAEDKNYFKAVQEKALKVLANPHVLDVIKLSYCAVFVDEYQDCEVMQHEIIMKLAQVLPVHVLGDELQGIFGFVGRLVDFDRDLQGFTKFDLLRTPWRWHKEGNCKELGDKILAWRDAMLSDNKQIKLVSDVTAHVEVYLEENEALDNDMDYYRHLREAIGKYDCDSLLIIFPSYFADGRLRGTITDRVRCKDFIDFAHRFVLVEAIDAKEFYSNARSIDELIRVIGRARAKEKKLYEVIDKLTFNKTDLNEWIDKNAGRIKKRQGENRAKSEKLAELFQQFVEKPSKNGVLNLINFFMKDVKMRPKRYEIVTSILYCLRNYPEEDMSVYKSMEEMRNIIRRSGRKIQGRCIGTTLLTKGLEFDNVIVLDAHRFEDSKNFYVAISRACKNLAIFTKKDMLHFEK